MFELEGNLVFVNIDQSYVKKLHDVCSEVFYKPNGYQNKPYIGIMINKNNKIYDKQMKTGKVAKYCCDFIKLEKIVYKE